MKIGSVDILGFSPTGTTWAVERAIGRGIGVRRTRKHDVTPVPRRRWKPPRLQSDLLIIGAPVYFGRVQSDAAAFFRSLPKRKRPTPFVPIVVYGNRAFEDALLELYDIGVDRGYVPIAAASFVGEHSYSTPEQPIAAGRPDEEDLGIARSFGTEIRSILERSGLDASLSRESIPGNTPYRDVPPPLQIAPSTDMERCNLCGKCPPRCPTAAFALSAIEQTDPELCIQCSACVRLCPVEARDFVAPGYVRIRDHIATLVTGRKEPEIFL